MAATADQSIAQRGEQGDEQYRALLAYVTGAESRSAGAYDVEVRIFRAVLALGRTLLRLFFESRAAVRPAGPVVGTDGTALAYHDRRPVTYLSVFGKVVFRRHAFTAVGQGVVCPLDAALSLPERCYSDLLREWSGFGSADASFHEVAASLERILGWPLSIQAIETTAREDAVDVPAFYEQPVEEAAPTEAASILVAQADGKGDPDGPAAGGASGATGQGAPEPSPARGGGHRALHHPALSANPRGGGGGPPARSRAPAPDRRPRPVNKELRATLDGKAIAVTRLAARARRREGAQIHDSGGAHGWGRGAPGEDARGAAGPHPGAGHHPRRGVPVGCRQRRPRRAPSRAHHLGPGHLLALLRGQTDEVVTALTAAAAEPTRSAAQRTAIAATIRYYRRNAPYMHYDQYLAQGWPIGTGVIESACGHLVKDRMEQAGMRWTKDGAHAILDLRAVRLTDDWDAYWAFHRQCQHQRLYGTASPLPATPRSSSRGLSCGRLTPSIRRPRLLVTLESKPGLGHVQANLFRSSLPVGYRPGADQRTNQAVRVGWHGHANDP